MESGDAPADKRAPLPENLAHWLSEEQGIASVFDDGKPVEGVKVTVISDGMRYRNG